MQHPRTVRIAERRPAHLHRAPDGHGGPAARLGWHLPDPEHPGERGDTPLRLLHPLQQPVQRLDRLLQVERGGDHLTQADPAPGQQDAAGEQHGRDRDRIAPLHHRKDHRPQGEGGPAGGPHRADASGAVGDPLPAQPQRLGGTGALGGRGQRLGQLRRRGPLGQVGRGGPAQVPAHRRQDRREPGERHQAEQRVQQEHRAEQQHQVGTRDDQHRHHVAQHGAHRGHVHRAPGCQVTGAGVLHHRDGQAEQPGHEVLAQPGHRPLTEPVPGVLGVAGEQPLGQHATADGERQPVHRAGARAGGDLVDDPTDQPRRGQPGERGGAVQHQHDDHRPPVTGEHVPRGPAYHGGTRDRKSRHRTGRPTGSSSVPPARDTSRR